MEMSAGAMAPEAVANGIDTLAAENFEALREDRIALVATDGSGTLDGKRSIDVLAALDGASLYFIYEPDFSGDTNPDGAADATTNVPIIALDGDERSPTESQLESIDRVLVDLPDCGSRLTPMIALLGHVLEACAHAGKPVWVLDRPNPLDGFNVEGPSNDASIESLFSYHPLPLRHGLTLGELARLLNRERAIDADLRVVTMAGWQRAYLFENTGQRWVEPLPGISSQRAALMYPALGLFEETNISTGSGTSEPLSLFGAPWLDGTRLATELHEANLAGLKAEPHEFTPDPAEIVFGGQRCGGLRFTIDDVQAFSPPALALALIKALRRLYPQQWEYSKIEALLARSDLIEAIEDQAPELDDLWVPDPEFFEVRAKYLLY